MTEEIDLNAFRPSGFQEQQETKDQTIERLNREINELEQVLQKPGHYDRFVALPLT